MAAHEDNYEFIITHSGEGDRQGTDKTSKEQGEQRGMLNTCCTNISARAGFGSLRDKKADRKKSVRRRILPKGMNPFQANLLLGSKDKRRTTLRY